MRRPLALLCFVLTVASAPALPAETAPCTSLHIVASMAHDPKAFTQGLLFHDGHLYESTGLYGASTLRRIDAESGEVTHHTALDGGYFGEGIARVDDRLYWLTWKAGIVFVFDADTLSGRGHFRYSGQGWGLTFDGRHLIMSDGTATLRVIDPDDFSLVRRLTVHDGARKIDDLNELEYIEGEIWANVWYEDEILRIDPASGQVIAVIHAQPLREALPDGPAQALNGIAYDAERGRILVTGKYWPRLFEIEVGAATHAGR